MATDGETIAGLLAKSDPITWVFAGDSITQGALHTMGWRDHVELFGERVRWELRRYRDAVVKTGVSGWKVQTLAADLKWSVLRYEPDVVSIALGMNDCVAGADGAGAFRSGLKDLVTAVRRERPRAAVLLHTPVRILPADALRFPNLPHYIDAVIAVAGETGAVLVDHHAAWAEAETNGTIPYWLSDPCHPNECGHRAMARTLLQAVGLWDPASVVGRLFVP